MRYERQRNTYRENTATLLESSRTNALSGALSLDNAQKGLSYTSTVY